MGFVAKQAVAKLEYDFTGLGIAGLDDVKGCSPEPTAEQVLHMQFELRELFHLDNSDPGAINQYLSSLSEDEYAEHDAEIARIYADVCSQQPTTKQILALPHRIRAAYIGYLSGELNTPTAGSSVTRRSLAPVKTA